MHIRKVAIENTRSFLDRAEITFDDSISIIIGPNGGGKTNLLDIVVTLLRRFLIAAPYAAHSPSAKNDSRHELRPNDVLNSMVLERHSNALDKPQRIEIQIAVTEPDIVGMKAIKDDAQKLEQLAGYKYANLTLNRSQNWRLDEITIGSTFTYFVTEGMKIKTTDGPAATTFLEYLNLFEIDGWLRQEFGLAPLAMPMVYFSVNRSIASFQSRVQLAGFNEFEHKRQTDGALSRNNSSMIPLAIGRLAQKYRYLLEQDNGTARENFYADSNIAELSKIMSELGYRWSLKCTDYLKNQYDILLEKQGSSFLIDAASSGERELLTYLFAIFALNVKNAIIVIDEPELHLHPTWQRALLDLFSKLTASTGNQFLMATHSPTFISPKSIKYVSRVFSREQKSHILALNAATLPESKHLIRMVNSQNNERLFFADRVVLVEGISDRIFFEAVFAHFAKMIPLRFTLEIISVDGKGQFDAYRKLLGACQISYSVIADLDYIEQLGTEDIKSLFAVDCEEIKSDVIENVKSRDGNRLFETLDQAIRSGDFSDAQDVWDYIKGHRRRLKKDLAADEKVRLDHFLSEMQESDIYILAAGGLEDYLPEGHRAKDIGKLITLIERSNFWEELPNGTKLEIEKIVQSILEKERVSNFGTETHQS